MHTNTQHAESKLHENNEEPHIAYMRRKGTVIMQNNPKSKFSVHSFFLPQFFRVDFFYPFQTTTAPEGEWFST